MPFPEPMPSADGKMSHTKIFIYPCYIDSNIKTFSGRKIPKAFGVPDPFIDEVSMAICDLKLDGVFSIQKRHPRNFWKFGRASVDFYIIDEKTGEKKPKYEQYPTRKDLLKAIAAQIRSNREKPNYMESRRIKGKNLSKKR